ncbi:hypothetical protein SADUNF_Sadunf17G0072600 [Salix dunnii]|uniref:Uncharacterized protein n=1 Tax=Salix dunnii TaxID=1413687 RepID=A0A835J5W1_9ROSI|nr:hypothetical protein SADUNF_Sadunf17G0072600 [Salix dunnii]
MSPDQCYSENPASAVRNRRSICSESLRFTHTIVYFHLTFNTIGTIYSAYTNNDIPMVAFIVFVYFGYFIVDHCLVVFDRLPSDEESPRKVLLKVTIWSFTSAILFGFAYQFSTFMSPVVFLPMYGIAIASSAILFYVHFIYDAQRGCYYKAGGGAKSFEILSSPGSTDRDIDPDDISTLEKV